MAMKFRGIKGAPGKDHMTSHWSREVRKIIESHLPLKGDMWSLPGRYLYPVAIIQSCWPHEKIRPAVRLHPLKCLRQFSMNTLPWTALPSHDFPCLRLTTLRSTHHSLYTCQCYSVSYLQVSTNKLGRPAPAIHKYKWLRGHFHVFSICSNRWEKLHA